MRILDHKKLIFILSLRKSKDDRCASFGILLVLPLILYTPLIFADEQHHKISPAELQSPQYSYIVQKDDTLMKFFRSLGLSTLWATAGRRKLNAPKSAFSIDPLRSLNLIYPGDNLILGPYFQAIILDRERRGLIEISKNGQIHFLCSLTSLKAWVELRKELAPSVDPFAEKISHFAKDCLEKLNSPLSELTHATSNYERKIASVKEDTPQASPVEKTTPAVSPNSQTLENPTLTADSQVDLFLGSGYSELKSQYKATNSKAHLLSGNITSISLRWIQHWSDSVDSFVKWNYFSTPFERADVGLLNNPSQSGSDFAIGASYHFSEGLHGHASIGNQVAFFAPSYSTGTASLEKRVLPAIEISLLKDLARARSLKLRAGIGLTYLGSASMGSYDIEPGASYSGILQIEQSLKYFRIFSDFSYKATHQNTSITESDYNEVWMKFGLSWDLGGQ